VLLTATASAGPVEFGRAELDRAAAKRGIKVHVTVGKTTGEPESFLACPGRITAPDDRGLMYGLLEAAEQIRDTGRIQCTAGSPATPMRGIRIFLHNHDLEKNWYYSRDYWQDFLAMLARNRFNRFNLVFAHQTNYLAPPYPFWLAIDAFPEIRAPGLSDDQRARNLEMLRFISDTAAEYAIDFTLGIWEHNVQQGMTPTVVGITPQNIGPYSYAALKKVLHECPNIRSVQMRTNSESGIPNDRQVEFYREWVFRAIREAGRPVTLDLRGWAMQRGMMDAAENAGVPLRLSSKYWAEDIGRPYQPAETFPGYSYINFLEKPRPYGFYFEVWGLGSHRLLLWGDPQFVRRAVPTFRLSGALGFEIDPPLAQKGFGNRPGEWGVFTEQEQRRVFWKWGFERYWMFYLLWGRLSYGPHTPDRVWKSELTRRFGAAAGDVLAAYESSGRVLSEIVAAHLADPNMYIWPEINPGGLIDAYLDVRPSDWRTITTAHSDGAKQGRVATARLLDSIAVETEKAVDLARKRMAPGNREWLSSEPDFEVLAMLARYHARKQMAAESLSWFYETADEQSLSAANQELVEARADWQRLVRLTDGLYPEQMAFGPEDVGHWKDKLPYVQHDLDTIAERADIYQRLGRFVRGFDFGGPVTAPRPYRNDPYVVRNTVEPRFDSVDPTTIYTEERGFGWLRVQPREANTLTLTPYAEVRATAKNPQHLPHNVLFGDSIRGSGAQVFRVKLDGEYDVLFLHPDKTVETKRLTSVGGHLDIAFPPSDWDIAGLVIKPVNPMPSPPHWEAPLELPRPTFRHTPPQVARAGEPLALALSIAPSKDVATVRLHYRAVDQLAKFKMLEAPASSAAFTIPGEHVSGRWDLLYYFEILNRAGSGWFYPDPATATPYFVVTTR
jgi:hypothetical protein